MTLTNDLGRFLKYWIEICFNSVLYFSWSLGLSIVSISTLADLYPPVRFVYKEFGGEIIPGTFTSTAFVVFLPLIVCA